MLSTIGRRVIASLVGFFVGWMVFQVVRPLESLPVPASAPATQISAITLKAYGCSDAELECAIYDVTFRSDGTALYHGYANDEDFHGTFTATFDQRDFTYLTEQFEKQRFFELPQHYGALPADEEIVLEVTTNEGVRVVTTNDWPATPNEIRVLQAVVYQEIYRLVWDESK